MCGGAGERQGGPPSPSQNPDGKGWGIVKGVRCMCAQVDAHLFGAYKGWKTMEVPDKLCLW